MGGMRREIMNGRNRYKKVGVMGYIMGVNRCGGKWCVGKE